MLTKYSSALIHRRRLPQERRGKAAYSLLCAPAATSAVEPKIDNFVNTILKEGYEIQSTRLSDNGALAPCLALAASAFTPILQSRSDSLTTEDQIVTTKHQIRVGGRVLRYTARAGRAPILDNETGEVHAKRGPGAEAAWGAEAETRI